MLAQLALEEKDVASAVEKLGKSLQIKKNLFTDPDNIEIQRTVAQLNDLYNKLKKSEVFETPIDQVVNQRPKQFSFNQPFGQESDDSPKSPQESDKPSIYRPKRMNDEIHKEAEYGELQGKFNTNQFGKRQLSGPMTNPSAAGKTQARTSLKAPDNSLLRVRTDSGNGSKQPPPFGNVNESMNKFLASQKGKAISEETESEDLEDEIEDQMNKKGKSNDKSSSDDEEFKQIEVKGKEELKKRLDPIQLIKFDMLKDDVYHRSIEANFNPLQTILASDFYKSLTPKSKEKFHELNSHIIKI
jgi:hypothetical protein